MIVLTKNVFHCIISFSQSVQYDSYKEFFLRIENKSIQKRKDIQSSKVYDSCNILFNLGQDFHLYNLYYKFLIERILEIVQVVVGSV